MPLTIHERDLLSTIDNLGGLARNQGYNIGFYPSDDFLTILTQKYNVELASVFTMGINEHYLYAGTSNSILIPIASDPNFEILIKHTHPRGTELPSIYDINWLRDSQNEGSPQKKSIILPLGKVRVSFNIDSPFIS